MSANDPIAELMLRWEAGRQEGKDLKPEELCADCPDLTNALRQRIGVVKKMEQLLGIGDPEGTLPPLPWEHPPPPLPQIPGYEIIRVLNQGGMGVVFLARQAALGRTVALKMISGVHLAPAALARFRAETEAAARLQHPNVVQIFEVGQVDGRPFFSMEYVEGGNLAQHVTRIKPFPRRAAELVETLARAVHAAHERGIVHRDLKPANILMSSEGREARSENAENISFLATRHSPLATIPKIADFGLAKRLDVEASSTQTGEVMGTPSYMAPEQAKGNKDLVGPLTDVYSLGTILYELLTGQTPFRGASPLETLSLIAEKEPASPTKFSPGVPRDLSAICLKCLEKTPNRRYGSAQDLADDLRRFLDGLPVQARHIGPLGRTWKLVKRHPQWTVAIIAVGLLALLPLMSLVQVIRDERQLRLRAEELSPQVGEILRRNCFECHGQNRKDIKKNLDVMNHALLLDKTRKIVVPGKWGDSRLIKRIEDGSMPPEEEETRLPRVTEEELAILKDWILGGAPPFPSDDPDIAPVVASSPLAGKVKQIFRKHCYECHRYDVAKFGIKILNHRLLVNQRMVVIPHHPEESDVFEVITTPDEERRMPKPPLPRLTAEEIETVRQWILDGAPPFPKGNGAGTR